MKFINKFICSLFLISFLFMIFSMNNIQVNASDIESQANTFIIKGKGEAGNVDTTEITKQFTEIGQLLSYIGAGVMVAVTSYLGIQYIVSPPDKQGALKEKLIAVVASGIVIFGAYSIWKTVINIVEGF